MLKFLLNWSINREYKKASKKQKSLCESREHKIEKLIFELPDLHFEGEEDDKIIEDMNHYFTTETSNKIPENPKYIINNGVIVDGCKYCGKVYADSDKLRELFYMTAVADQYATKPVVSEYKPLLEVPIHEILALTN